MRRTTRLLLALWIVAACGAAVALNVEQGSEQPASAPRPPSPRELAVSAARRFLDGYVDADGRVVRRDQGGDTVSEGQSYALLLAVAIGDRTRFEAVWRWTREHLIRPDGLLSTHWRAGRAIDAHAAADADLDAAWALALAAERFHSQGAGRASRALARAVVRHETVRAGQGPVLVAGPWARRERVVNPSYFSPRAYAALAGEAPDDPWRALERSSRAVVGALTAAPGELPPDWAAVDVAGRARAIASPNGPLPPRYGLDAVRVPIRMAASCQDADRRLAAGLWPRLRSAAVGGAPALAYTLDGRRLSSVGHPASTVAAAAAARAAGRLADSRRLLDAADDQQRRHPTYYGGAWVALGRVLLDTDLLGGCPR